MGKDTDQVGLHSLHMCEMVYKVCITSQKGLVFEIFADLTEKLQP